MHTFSVKAGSPLIQPALLIQAGNPWCRWTTANYRESTMKIETPFLVLILTFASTFALSQAPNAGPAGQNPNSSYPQAASGSSNTGTSGNNATGNAAEQRSATVTD
jgi:hypothetical protein